MANPIKTAVGIAAMAGALLAPSAFAQTEGQRVSTSPSAATEGPRVTTSPVLEGPRVSTSPLPVAEGSPQGSAATTEGPSVSTSSTAESPQTQSQPTAVQSDAPTADAQPAARRSRGASDRLDLETTIVTGNRELPKVLYIVPWKKADIGELPAQPFNTLLDEALTPVDRDVFRREVTYYGAVSSAGGASDAAPVPQAGGTEK